MLDGTYVVVAIFFIGPSCNDYGVAHLRTMHQVLITFILPKYENEKDLFRFSLLH